MAGDVEDYVRFWWSDGGDLDVHKHQVEERLSGSLITEAAQPEDGDNDGDIEIGFTARRCKPMERYVFGSSDGISFGSDTPGTSGPGGGGSTSTGGQPAPP